MGKYESSQIYLSGYFIESYDVGKVADAALFMFACCDLLKFVIQVGKLRRDQNKKLLTHSHQCRCVRSTKIIRYKDKIENVLKIIYRYMYKKNKD